ncbi:hypothetical protein IJ425_03545 [bacterium]|nr:hypothetical protein [bacterium]
MMINSSGAAAGSAIIHIGWVHDLLESAIGFKKVFLMRYSYWEPCALIERSLIAVLCIVIYLFYSHLKNKSSW